MSPRCPKCKALLWEGHKALGHRCPPLFRAWVPEDGDEEEDADDVYDLDAECAAETFIEERGYDGDSYDHLSRDGVLVHLRDEVGTLTKVRVFAEATIYYRSRTEEPDE